MSDSKQKGDDFPGSHVVGDRVGDKRVDAAQEQKTPDYNTAQPTNEKLKEKAEENLSERNRKEPTNFEVKDGYATASVNPLDKGDDHTLKSK